ncbi:hypothetical protein Pcinc_019919 [Petrolisthes cinctipes]|uniref:Uncharacterized protein n=1 Tax=Petrolisthes cinctipes TaxID=88211 RepID=A0AAE1FL67_PETCI|nr:hypothetical protein Pcinc_019919 [Petrolisthes cinctipes]
MRVSERDLCSLLSKNMICTVVGAASASPHHRRAVRDRYWLVLEVILAQCVVDTDWDINPLLYHQEYVIMWRVLVVAVWVSAVLSQRELMTLNNEMISEMDDEWVELEVAEDGSLPNAEKYMKNDLLE